MTRLLTCKVLTATALTMALLAACSSDREPDPQTSPTDAIPSTPDPGLFVMPYSAILDAIRERKTVSVTDSGCAYITASNGEPFLLAFQPGSVLVGDPPRVVLQDGSEMFDGGTYDIGGGGIDESELALPEVTPRWNAAVAACRESGIVDFAPGAWFVASIASSPSAGG